MYLIGGSIITFSPSEFRKFIQTELPQSNELREISFAVSDGLLHKYAVKHQKNKVLVELVHIYENKKIKFGRYFYPYLNTLDPTNSKIHLKNTYIDSKNLETLIGDLSKDTPVSLHIENSFIDGKINFSNFTVNY